MTHSSSQTSITGLRDWYTHKPQTIFQTYCPSGQGNLLLQSFMCSWSILQVAVLLHVGGSGEHLYLLCHLLCCPAGVGKWAAHFLQVSQEHTPVIYHFITSIATHTEEQSSSLLSYPDPSLGEHLWSSAIYASSGHFNVTCQVKMQVST